MRNILKLRGSARGALAGLRKAFYGLRGFDQVSGEDTSSDNDCMTHELQTYTQRYDDRIAG